MFFELLEMAVMCIYISLIRMTYLFVRFNKNFIKIYT